MERRHDLAQEKKQLYSKSAITAFLATILLSPALTGARAADLSFWISVLLLLVSMTVFSLSFHRLFCRSVILRETHLLFYGPIREIKVYYQDIARITLDDAHGISLTLSNGRRHVIVSKDYALGHEIAPTLEEAVRQRTAHP